MIARMAGTVVLSAIVFVVVSLLVGLGVLWWSGGPTLSATVGMICGLTAAFLVGAAGIAVGRSQEQPRARSGEKSNRSGGRSDR